jgi:hypothetical protein
MIRQSLVVWIQGFPNPELINCRTLASDRLLHSLFDPISSFSSVVYGSMAFIRVDSHSVPVTFPLGANGYAIVSSTTLCLRFQFREDALYVEEEIFDNHSGIFLHAIGQLHSTNDAGMFWSLKLEKYRAYGLPDFVMPASTKILISSTIVHY